MSVTICAGGGAVGTKAAVECRRRSSRVLVIDTDEHCMASTIADATVTDADQVLSSPPGTVMLMVGEGALVLDRVLDRWMPDLVVPASSGHFAAHLAVSHCRRGGRGLAPTADLEGVINTMPEGSVQLADERSGVIVASYMGPGGTCLDDCEQPPKCPVTGITSPMPMFQAITKALSISVDLPLVLRTTGTGHFGGMGGRDLGNMLASIDGLNCGDTCGIATACGCHGIINLFRVIECMPGSRLGTV